MVTDAVPAGSGGCGTQPSQDGGKGTQSPYPVLPPLSAVTSGACGALSTRDLRQSPNGPGITPERHGICVAQATRTAFSMRSSQVLPVACIPIPVCYLGRSGLSMVG